MYNFNGSKKNIKNLFRSYSFSIDKYFYVIRTKQYKKENEVEYFKFQSAKLLTGMNFNKFLEAIEKGIIVYDIRIGI